MNPDVPKSVRDLLLGNAREHISQSTDPLLALLHVVSPGQHDIIGLDDMDQRHQMVAWAIEQFKPVYMAFCYDGYVTAWDAEAEPCAACVGDGCEECVGQGKQPSRARKDALILVEWFPGKLPQVYYQHYTRVGGTVLWEDLIEPVEDMKGESAYPILPEVTHA
jgi:hypothetical protein